MDPRLATLSDDQVLRVLVEVFEVLPGQSKPGYDELDLLLSGLRDESEGEARAALARIATPDARAALARRTLGSLSERTELRPFVDQAFERGARAHMMALPELIAGVVVVLALLPSHFEREASGAIKIDWQHLQNVPAILKPIADILSQTR